LAKIAESAQLAAGLTSYWRRKWYNRRNIPHGRAHVEKVAQPGRLTLPCSADENHARRWGKP
jgi:hypothetical protein